ncbi:hypothetical protein ABZ354_07285 [Streptomyces sp. NPDC005925]|uniref:hypothetical protein n=1 Tax=Streptomyces sp. NPDC005925 TaxID=3157172 RepID=UPI0034016D93
MFRLVREAVARLFTGSGPGGWDTVPDIRTPDPCVRRLPTPYDARWRRWYKRCRAAGRYLPFPADEACWQDPPSTASTASTACRGGGP